MTSPIDAVAPQASLPTTYHAAQSDTSSGTSNTQLFDSQMFLQLLVAQLKYQDPTNPTDTSEFMSQSAVLSQVETMNSMSATLTELVTSQQAASATSMIGKAIAFVDPSGRQTEGVVDTVSLSGGHVHLHVGDYAVPIDGVLAVADASALNPPPADGDNSGDDVIPSETPSTTV